MKIVIKKIVWNNFSDIFFLNWLPNNIPAIAGIVAIDDQVACLRFKRST